MTNPERKWEVVMARLAADPLIVLPEQREALEQLVRGQAQLSCTQNDLLGLDRAVACDVRAKARGQLVPLAPSAFCRSSTEPERTRDAKSKTSLMPA
jgi:hypothetical protein